MKNTFFFILFFFLTLIGCKRKTSEQYLKSGNEKADKFDCKGAIEDYSKAIKINPSEIEAYFKRGIAYNLYWGGCNADYNKAIEDYSKIIDLDPSLKNIFILRGNARSAIGLHKEAIEDYSKEIKNNNSLCAYIFRADEKEKIKDYIGEILDYSEAINIRIKQKLPNFEFYIKRGDLKQYIEDYRGAIEDYNKAKEDSMMGTADFIIGIGFSTGIDFHLKKKDLSFPYYCDYVGQIDFNPFLKIADAKKKLGDYSGAIDEYSKLIKKVYDNSPNDPLRIIALEGRLNNLKSDSIHNQKAIKELINEIKNPPKEYEFELGKIFILRGELKEEIKDYKGTIADFTKAIETDSKYSYSIVGDLRAKINDYQGAIIDYSKAIEINPNDTSALCNRGYAKIKLGKKESACLDFSKAGELGHKYAYEMIKKYCN